MSKKEPKQKELKPWDRRPWPLKGDRSINKTYAAVGRALSQWERYEGSLSLLFAALVAGMNSVAARRAYSAVRTFEARTEMLRAASQAHFATYPDPEVQELFKDVIRDASNFGPRRNDIAHGVVDHFQKGPAPKLPRPLNASFSLYPSYASFRERDLLSTPSYCCTSVEMDYFTKQFYRIAGLPSRISGHLLLRDSTGSLANRALLLVPESANQEPQNKSRLGR